MFIKILKPFSLQGKKYKAEDTLEIKDEHNIPTEPFWFNRLQDKDIRGFTLQEYCEYYVVQKNIEQFELYAKQHIDVLQQTLDNIAKIPNDKITAEQKELKKETELSIKNLNTLESELKNPIISKK